MKKNTMKKALALLVILAMMIPCLPVVASADVTAELDWYNEGNGVNGEFIIDSVEDLAGFMSLRSTETFVGKTVKLGRDIHWNENAEVNTTTGEFTLPEGATKNVWSSFGTSSNPFKGIFDGQGHTIYGLYSSNGPGFFNYVQGTLDAPAEIKNVRFENCLLQGSSEKYVGVVASRLLAYTIVENVVVSGCGAYSTKGNAGGLTAQFSSSAGTITVKNCVVEDVYLKAPNVKGAFAYITGSNNAITIKLENCVNNTPFEFVNTDNAANANVTYDIDNCIQVKNGVATLFNNDENPDTALSFAETNKTNVLGVDLAVEGVLVKPSESSTDGKPLVDARFVSSIKFSDTVKKENIKEIGFEIARTSAFVTETKDIKTDVYQNVYESVKATFEGNEEKVLKASDFNQTTTGEGDDAVTDGADYLATLVMKNIPAKGLQSVVVRNYYVGTDGVTYYGSYAVVTFLDGQPLASGHIAYAE